MEILQTIWNILLSENELILNIISIPMVFIEVTISFFIFTNILNISYTKMQKFTYIISFSFIALATIYLIPTPYNTFVNIIAMPVLIFLILKTNILKAILSEILVYATLFIIVTPLVSLYTTLFKTTSIDVAKIPIHKFLYSSILYILMFFVFKLIKKLKFHITFLDKFDAYNHNLLTLNFIIGTIAIALQAYTQYLYMSYIPNYLIILSLIVLLLYFLISLYSLYRTSQLEETKQLLDAEKIYNKTLNTLHDNIRGFNHDFNNMVQAIGGYISSNNMEGLKAYYNDLLGDCQRNNTLSILNPELINNPAIYSLLADKYYTAEEKRYKNQFRSLHRFKQFKYKNI